MYEWQLSIASGIVGHLIIKCNWVASKKGFYFTTEEKYMIYMPSRRYGDVEWLEVLWPASNFDDDMEWGFPMTVLPNIL